MGEEAKVKSIFIYPIKSCRGISLSQAPLSSTGFRWDRQWVVVNSKGRACTQRVDPKLALVEVELPENAFSLGWKPSKSSYLVGVCDSTRLNIEKLDGNIVQKYGGSKQVRFKQLGPGVETGVHGVHDEKRVWFEVELQGAQGDREAEIFQVSNDDTAVAQIRLEDKEEKDKHGLLGKGAEKGISGWKIKTGNVLDSCNQRSTQQCLKSTVAKHLGVAGIQQQNGLVDETNVTLFAKVRCFLRSPSSAIGFKKPIDMLGFFGCLASIKQGMLEPVKVKYIFLGYHKSIVGNKLWRLDDVTSKVVLNMGFNESGEYKKTFIGSGVGTGSMQVLHGFDFEVEPQENVDQGAGLQEVQTQNLMDYQLTRDREQHLACELFGNREDSNEAEAAFAVEKIYAHESLTFNNTVACEVISKWKARLKEDNGKAVTTTTTITYYWLTSALPNDLLVKAKGNILGLEIIRDRSGSLKANLHHMEALSTTKAGYMTFTDRKKEIWLKGLLESGKGCSWSEVLAHVKVAAYRY
ncbi:zinc finger, CCHC-type containing protein [Tanacetum coccineum]